MAGRRELSDAQGALVEVILRPAWSVSIRGHPLRDTCAALIWRGMFLVGMCAVGLSWVPVTAQEASSAPRKAQMIMRVTTREVLLDVMALDRRHNPVNDLATSEMQVFELGKRGEKTEKRVLSMRSVDPRKDASHAIVNDQGFRISWGAICALNATTHYELAIEASPGPGYHEVLVTTTRPQVTLSFRRRYFVGEPSSATLASKKHKAADGANAVGEATCIHPRTPPTLLISAHPIAAPGEKTTRYFVIVRPESLSEIGLDGSNMRVQLDFGVCTFDAIGAIGKFQHWALERELTAAEMEQAQMSGLVNMLEIPGAAPPALARFAVRDRETGNLGIVDVAQPLSLAAQADRANVLPRPKGSIRSFGSVTPRAHTFCGDVYELPQGTARLPDFWNFDSVGSIYTDTLQVWNQDIFEYKGIPGVTPNHLWFGIDYYGEFYITKPGEYLFELQSDDGSRLEIDNQLLLDIDGLHPVELKVAQVNLASGRHTIHVPYFQGLPYHLALVLRIKPPGEPMRLFNLNEFAPPQTAQ